MTVFGAWEERPEVLITGGASSTDKEEHPPATIDDGEGRLAVVVSEHEVGYGGGAVSALERTALGLRMLVECGLACGPLISGIRASVHVAIRCVAICIAPV